VLPWLFLVGTAVSAQPTAHGDALIDPDPRIRFPTGPLAHVFDEGLVAGSPDINTTDERLRIDLLEPPCTRDDSRDGSASYYVQFAPAMPGTALGLLSFGDREITDLTFGDGCFRLTAASVRTSPAPYPQRALEHGQDGLYLSGSGTMLAFVVRDDLADVVRVIVAPKPLPGPSLDVRITSCTADVSSTPTFRIGVAATIDTRVVLLAPWASDCSSGFPSSSFATPMHELALASERAGELVTIDCVAAAMPGRTFAAVLPDEAVIDTDPANNLVPCSFGVTADAGVMGTVDAGSMGNTDAAAADASSGFDASLRDDGGTRPRRDGASRPASHYEFRGGGGCGCSTSERIAPPWGRARRRPRGLGGPPVRARTEASSFRRSPASTSSTRLVRASGAAIPCAGPRDQRPPSKPPWSVSVSVWTPSHDALQSSRSASQLVMQTSSVQRSLHCASASSHWTWQSSSVVSQAAKAKAEEANARQMAARI
jgi:hypothetical protein